MTEEKRKCLDEWIWINVSNKSKKRYILLNYEIYKDYYGNSYFVIHPWDLSTSSNIKVNVTYEGYGTRKIEFKSYYKCKSPTPLISVVVGARFGSLVVLERTNLKNGNQIKYRCLCDCGNEVLVTSSDLTTGHTRSCGCYRKEQSKKRITAMHRARGHRIRADFTDEQNKKFDKEISNFYKSPKWKEARKPILEEETCICCGGPGNTVHHTYSRYFFRAFQYNQAHLVLLCPECHAKYHSSLKFNCSIPALFENWLLKEKEKC